MEIPSIFKNKVFMTVLVDTVVSLVTYFGGKYGGASGQDMIYVVGVLQVPAVAMIKYYCDEANNISKAELAAFQAILEYPGEDIASAMASAKKH